MADEIPTTFEEQEEYFALQSELVQAQLAYERAQARMDQFERDHDGQSFRVFSDEMVAGICNDDIEPLEELQGLGW